MAENGRNGWVVRWLVGTLWGVLMAVILFMGNTVKANDVENKQEHISIRKEITAGDNALDDKISKDIKEIQAAQTTMLIQQTKILTILEKKIECASST